MKKYICITLVLTLIFALCSCYSTYTPAPEHIIGTWEYSNHTEYKDLLTDIFDDSYFYKVYYQFNEDGSGSSWLETNPDKKLEFNYEFDGKVIKMIYNDGTTEDVPCDFSGNSFTVTMGGTTMKFVKIK